MIRQTATKFCVPYKALASFALLLALAGCSTAPANRSAGEETGSAVSASGPGVASVIKNPELHQRSSVRWGGTLVSIENTEDATLLEIIGRPLNSDGRPIESEQSSGRFLAVVPGFLDPIDYRTGQAITIDGTVEGSDSRNIGGASYDYPRVLVADHQLWEPATAQVASYRKRGYYYPYYPYYAPFRGSISIGFGSRFRFGLSGSKRFGHGRFGFRHNRGYSRFRHRGFSGHRGFRGHRRSRGFRH